MNQPEAPPTTGLVAGKYQLVAMIGRGGMGSVWEARHASLGTRFAIKFIESEYADSQEARHRFDREARAAATIQSKHAIQIYDHGVTDDGKPYIVMELLQGEPLDKRIERLGALSLQDTARILQQVCRGLARAHERGIVHRDLKPENIFLVKTPEDDEEVAKVLDFGIAKIQSSATNPAVTSSTKTGAVLGTPFYMSPEQARGLRNVDHRTDVWSLGVIAYKCVTGKLPFDGESVGDLLVKICTAPVPVPSQMVPGLPPAFDAWFARALEREPERRFGTVTELAEHLAFAAGLGARGSMVHSGQASSGQSTVASGHLHTPPPHMATAPGGPFSHQGQNLGAATPQPGAMTAAPFTSEHVAGVPAPSRWKWVVGAAAAGLLVAGLGTGVAVMMKRKDTSSANSVGITAAPPSASELPGDKPADKPADPAAGAAAAAAAGAGTTASTGVTNTTTATTTTGTPTPVAGAKGVTGAKTGAKGATPTTAAKPGTTTADKPADKPAGDKPPPLPATTADKPVTAPPPPPPPPAKKPNKNDPGY